MKSKIVFLCLFTVALFSLQAQNEKLRVAVFDPTSSGTGIDEGTRMAVREIISSTFVNTGKYIIVERSLIERVMQEQQFTNSGAVDDSQASEIGRLAGANKIVLTVVAQAGNNTLLSVKLVDVNSASVEKQKTQMMGANQILDFVEPITKDLIKEISVEPAITNQQNEAVAQQTKSETPVTPQKTDEKVVEEAQAAVEPVNLQNQAATTIPNASSPTATKTADLNIQKGAKNKSTMFYAIGGVGLAVGVAASLLITSPYEEFGNAEIVKGKQFNLIYAVAGLAIGGVCIGKGIQLNKKAKAQPRNTGYYDYPSPAPAYADNPSRLDFVATGAGAGLRLTF